MVQHIDLPIVPDKPKMMLQNHEVLPLTVQFREQSHRFVDCLMIAVVPRVGETVCIQGDHERQVLSIFHAFDPDNHIVICTVTD